MDTQEPPVTSADADGEPAPDDDDDSGDEPDTSAEDDAGSGSANNDDAATPSAQPDAQAPIDASTPSNDDASANDASMDGGSDDAGSDASVDAGFDAGSLDAGSDAGSDAGVDAGAPDTGTPDTGTPDTGTPDTGAPDAGRDAAGDWTCFGKDLANTRYNASETTISKTSVPNLTRAWQRPAPGISATPAVVDDSAYWADWQGTVQATRVSDGSLRWSRTFPKGFTSSPCVSQGTVYVGDRFNTLYALNVEDGSTRWATPINGVDLTHLWSSPIVADGVVLIGISADGTNADRQPLPASTINTFRGAVVGVDATNGNVLWRFETTRVVGDATVYGAGVSVWSSAAVDLARGLMYIGTGNSYAAPASPYSDALLAIRFHTGELAWSIQFTPNDAYSGANPNGGPDFDIGAAPNLFTITNAGAQRDVVGVGDKGGRYRVFDRATGTLIWERQLDPGFNLTGRKTGGVIAPAAVANGRIFVASNTSWHDSRVWALNADDGAIVWTSGIIQSVNFGGPAVANGVLFFGGSGFRVDEDPPDSIGVGNAGELIAFDVDNGAVLYNTTLSAGRGAGFSVAYGHVFVGTGFTFYGYSDEPVDGWLEAFSVP